MDAFVNTKSSMRCYAVRLEPEEDLIKSLTAYVQTLDITAAFILTCVGSLKQAQVRLANASCEKEDDYIYIKEPVEIVSFVGTLSSCGGMHLHISLADREGKVVGGHLMPENAIVHTTVELVIGSCDGLAFQREFDQQTGYKELKIVRNS